MNDKTPKIDPSVIANLEKLSHLRLSPSQRDKIGDDLSKILGFAELISQLDLANVDPMTHAIQQVNVLRPDQQKPGSDLEQALSNAPKSDGQYYLVPRVLDA